MNKLLATLLYILLIISNIDTAFAEDQSNQLPKCVITTHCVRVNWKVDELEKSFKQAAEIIASTPRTTIIEQTDSYIHAESTSRIMRYIDDLELKAIPEKGLLQVRSESRVGVGDMGVNKKRVDELSYRLMANQLE